MKVNLQIIKNNTMKKLLLLLLLAPVLGFGQVLTDVLYLSGYSVYGDDKSNNQNNRWITADGTSIYANQPHSERVTKHVVPENKLWKIVTIYRGNSSSNRVFERKVGVVDRIDLVFSENNTDFLNSTSGEFFVHTYDSKFPYYFNAGTEFWISGTYSYKLVIYEYSLNSNSLSYNEPETIKNNSNTPVLFPNPTSSLLALNSDKEYDIEVYDMAGNKVMALTGNTIDMSHLSSATYIVKALDKVENEEVSYKVVKN